MKEIVYVEVGRGRMEPAKSRRSDEMERKRRAEFWQTVGGISLFALCAALWVGFHIAMAHG